MRSSSTLIFVLAAVGGSGVSLHLRIQVTDQ
jgi:hypothetical protein